MELVFFEIELGDGNGVINVGVLVIIFVIIIGEGVFDKDLGCWGRDSGIVIIIDFVGDNIIVFIVGLVIGVIIVLVLDVCDKILALLDIIVGFIILVCMVVGLVIRRINGGRESFGEFFFWLEFRDIFFDFLVSFFELVFFGLLVDRERRLFRGGFCGIILLLSFILLCIVSGVLIIIFEVEVDCIDVVFKYIGFDVFIGRVIEEIFILDEFISEDLDVFILGDDVFF